MLRVFVKTRVVLHANVPTIYVPIKRTRLKILNDSDVFIRLLQTRVQHAYIVDAVSYHYIYNIVYRVIQDACL